MQLKKTINQEKSQEIETPNQKAQHVTFFCIILSAFLLDSYSSSYFSCTVTPGLLSFLLSPLSHTYFPALPSYWQCSKSAHFYISLVSLPDGLLLHPRLAMHQKTSQATVFPGSLKKIVFPGFINVCHGFRKPPVLPIRSREWILNSEVQM